MSEEREQANRAFMNRESYGYTRRTKSWNYYLDEDVKAKLVEIADEWNAPLSETVRTLLRMADLTRRDVGG